MDMFSLCALRQKRGVAYQKQIRSFSRRMLPSVRYIPARNDESTAAARSSANDGNISLSRQRTQAHCSFNSFPLTYDFIFELALSRIDRSAMCNAACFALLGDGPFVNIYMLFQKTF
jgi:hypothetical protein